MLTGFLKKKSVILGIILFFLYHIAFNRYSGNLYLSYFFNNYSTGAYSGSVKKFSLFYGIEIESISIRSGKDFDNKIIFSAERLAILYNLPYLFFGKLKISELSLTKPFIQVSEKNGKLNIATLFPESKAKEEKGEPENKEILEEINTYIPVSAYINFFIDDLTFRLEIEKENSYFLTEEKNLDFKTLIETKRFKKIPLNANIISIFEIIKVSLNPTRELQVSISDKSNQLNQGFSTFFILELDSNSNPPQFYSKLNLGSSNIKIKANDRILPTFGFNIKYDVHYLPLGDTLELNELLIKFNEFDWLKANGKIKKAITDDREFDIAILDSNINLTPVSSIYKQIPNMPIIDFKGNIKLSPSSILGNMNNLSINTDIKIREFLLKQNKATHNIPFLNLTSNIILDLQSTTSPNVENPFPNLKSVSLKTDLAYNTLTADLTAEIESAKKISILLNIKNLNLRNFVEKIGGRLTAKATVEGNSFSSLNAELNASLNYLEYSIEGSKSGLQRIDLSFKSVVTFGEKFSLQLAKINKLLLKIKNHEFQEAIGLTVNGKLGMNPDLFVDLDSLGLAFDLNRLIPILPLNLKEQIAPLKRTIGIKPRLDGNLYFKDSLNTMNFNGILKLALPGINLNDFKSDFLIKISKAATGEISISKFIFSGLNGVLKGNISGNLIKKLGKEKPPLGPYYPSIQASISLDSENQLEIIKGIKFDGNFGLNFTLKDYSAKGKLASRNSNFFYYSGVCKEKDYSNCNLLNVNKINIDFPFEHDLKKSVTQNLIEGNKIKFISTYGQSLPPNFTIQNIIGTLPTLDTELFKYLQENGNAPGFTARLDYKENVLNISSLKISTLDGNIFGKDMLFNVGNSNIEEMEYAATIQIKDIDLKQLLPVKSRKEIEDGKIKADLNVSGKNIKDPISNLNLFFSVYKIGGDFGKSAIRIVSSSNLLTDGIIRSYSQINKIEVELSKGLIYTDISFQRSVLSTLFIGIENNQISQERMPLANFLNRAQSEISKYE